MSADDRTADQDSSRRFRYVVLGAGRQGTAAAYDLAVHGGAAEVVIADLDAEAADSAARRVGELLSRMATASGGDVAAGVPPATRAGKIRPAAIDVTAPRDLQALLEDADAALSAVPYGLNPAIADAAVRTRTSLCDLGGHLGIARRQHRHDAAARDVGISIIPNCGQVPGMGTSFMTRAIELLDEARHVRMWDGGLPESPRPPFHYLLTFAVEGLTNEYAEPGVFLRDGKITEVEPMSELETVRFSEPIGDLEAFVTGGGTDTMPWTYEGRLVTLENKTLRWPGHHAQLRAYWDLGLWSLEPVRVGAVEVVPRDLFHALFEPQVTFPDDRDLVVLRVVAEGLKEGAPARATLELVDRADAATGFTAMERCTGWSAAIVVAMAARGETRRGAGGVEIMVPAADYIAALRVRGIDVREHVDTGGN